MMAWVGILFSLGAVALLLWRVDFRDVRGALARAHVGWLVPGVALFFVMFAVRAWRWSLLLGRTRYWPTWHANSIGYMFNVTLPLRLGEIARVFVIAKAEDIGAARALSAALVERIVDLAFVVLMFAGLAQAIPMGPTFTRAAAIGSAFVVACVLGGAVMVIKGEAVERILRPRLARLGQSKVDAILLRFHEIREGFRALGSVSQIMQCFALTVVVWALTILQSAAFMMAFLPEQTDLMRAGLVVVIANLGGALPSAPGGLGIVQGFATSALVVPFHVPENEALAFVLVWSLVPQLLLILMGVVSMGRVGMSFSEIRRGASTDLGATK